MANPTEGPLLTGCWLLPIPARDSGISLSGFLKLAFFRFRDFGEKTCPMLALLCVRRVRTSFSTTDSAGPPTPAPHGRGQCHRSGHSRCPCA